MAKARLELATNLDAESFGGGSVTGGTSLRNGIIRTYSDGKRYITQRPSLAITQDASSAVSDARGRGIFFWEATSGLYFINNNTVYKDSYTTTVGTITAGIHPIEIYEMSSHLVLIDHENNEGWTITTGDTLAKITDADFPSTLTHGGAVLDGFMFVMDPNGTIYQSDLNDPTSWDALNVLTAEREEDKGVYLAKHLDHIVAFGTRTIEFFYNAANPSGSVLSRRPDLSYQVGMVAGHGTYNTGNTIYFIGSDRVGSAKIFKLDQFRLQEISTRSIDEYLYNTLLVSELDFISSGFSYGSHEFYILNAVSTIAGDFVADYTLVFDNSNGTWATWDLNLTGYTAIPVVKIADNTDAGARQNLGIFISGDIFRFTGTSDGTDLVSEDSSIYMDASYVEQQSDYVIELGSDESADMTLQVVTPEFDGEIRNNKFLHKLELVGEKIEGSTGTSDPTIRWTDDHYNTWSSSRTIDISSRRKLTRLGIFNRRAFELTYTGPERLRFEALELDWKSSGYA